MTFGLYSCVSSERLQYKRLMVIWSITTSFNGVYLPLSWLDTSVGSELERYLVGSLLVVSIGGIIGNVSMDPFTLDVRGYRSRGFFL